MKIAYVYHVTGTLDWRHVRWSMESLRNQDIHWDAFVLYNASSISDSQILRLVPHSMFDSVDVYPYDPLTPKSCVADWNEQMRGISGFDRYFVHKADFYLADGSLEAFTAISAETPWLALFHKFDTKEHTPIEAIRRYSQHSLEECLAFEETGSYDDHEGFVGIPFLQGEHGLDATMHGYSDDLRARFTPSQEEMEERWGVATALVRLAESVNLVLDPRLFALHVYHYVPEKTDPRKNIVGERF